MAEKKDFSLRNAVQGAASMALLWFVMFGDPTRLPTQWLASIPFGPLTSPWAFVICMALLYFIEGSKAAEWEAGKPVSPVKRVLECYIPYWKVCAPLVLIGGLFFCEISESPIYCPMFRNLGFLNVSRAVVALSNNIHEGTWLISSVAICALCASLHRTVRERAGGALALLTLAGGIAAQAVLYLKVMPFMYNSRVYRIAAIVGPTAYMLGFLLFQPGGFAANRLGRSEAGENRTLMALSRPFMFIGRNWTVFWMAQFYAAMYYYHVAASVYAGTRSAVASYLIFLAMTMLLLYGLEWGYRRLCAAVSHSWRTVPAILLTLAVPFLLRLALEVSMDSYAQFGHLAAQQWPIRAMVNVLAIFSLILILRALIGHWLPAGLIVTGLMTLLGVANHYTMKFHGALLTAEDIHNLGTVSGVIGAYDLSLDAVAGRILLLGAAAAACCVSAWAFSRALRDLYTRRQRWVNRGACLLTAALSLYFCYFSAVPIIAREDNIWSWGSLYAKIGYFSGTVESTLANLEFSVYRPEDYSEARIAEIAERAVASREAAPEAGGAMQSCPDIVMILNESWYNLDMYIDTHADADYLKNYRALDNAVKGYAEVPLTGGGTNGTEYEMLTGNSMTLINAYAPFNRLNFTDALSLPQYLKQFGYSTIAAHPHESQNYHRGMSWSQLGIDESYFVHDFTDLEYYADRHRDHEITDTCALKNVIRFMDALPAQKPRFAFLVTMQNHGEWNANKPEQAVVHAKTGVADPGLAAQIDEYLSCMAYTDAMIGFMQDYYTRLYEETGRRVVVCMVGDHSPSFLTELEPICKWSDRAVAERKGKMTPYFIWANYPLDLNEGALADAGDMDLCCLMPATLRAAGLPLSYYYGYILDMNRDVAVYTNVGSETAQETRRIAFYDRAGQLHTVDEDSPLARMVSDYFCMEYNLNGEDTRREPVLFEPAGTKSTGEITVSEG